MPDRRVVGELDHLLDEPLAVVVGRVRLAGDDELDRPLRVQQQAAQPLGVAQHQGEPLVRRHPAGEPDGEDVRVERRPSTQPSSAGLAPRLSHDDRTRCRASSTRLARICAADRPDLVVRDPVDAAPSPRAVASCPSGRCTSPPSSSDPAVDPGRGVHAVGDRGDRHLVGVEARPQAVEHLAADGAVQLGDAVGALRQPQAHHRHVEHRGVAAGDSPRRRARGSSRTGTPATALSPPKNVSIWSRPKRSMPAGTGVCVVKTVPARTTSSASSNVRPSLVDQLADPLEAEEAGVTLVGVVDVRRGRPGEPRPHPQGADAADAEQHLLLEPVLAAAAVEPVGDGAGGVVVLPRPGSRAAAAAPGRPAPARCARSGCGRRAARR